MANDWTEREARALADKILGHSKAPECELAITRVRSSYTRFAANDVTTSGAVEDLRITITSRGNRRSGSATISSSDPAALQRAVALSEELMGLAPEDPEFVEGLGAQKYPKVAGGSTRPPGPARWSAGRG